jgi:PKD repeat protein
MDAIFTHFGTRCCRLKILFCAIFLGISFTLLGQAPQLIPINAGANQYPLTFITDAQNVITAQFDQPVIGDNNPICWSVEIGGVVYTPALINIPGSDRVTISLPVSISFENRTSVKVSYNAGGGCNLRNSEGELVGSFNDRPAVNNRIVTCSDITGTKGIDITTSGTCAPVSVSIKYTWNFRQGARNSIYFQPSGMRLQVAWNDPANSTFYGTMTETSPGSGRFERTTTPFSYPDNHPVCSYTPEAHPRMISSMPQQPNVICTSGAVPSSTTIPSYRRDNLAPGEYLIYPEEGHPDNEYCVGEDIQNHRFNDITIFNCNFAAEPERPNVSERWIQFVYGTSNNLGLAGRIPNVWLDIDDDGIIDPLVDVQVTDEFGNLMPGMPYVGPVINYDQPPLPGADETIYPNAISLGIFHEGSFEDLPGMRFEVTMRQWGPCNPYEFGTGIPLVVSSYIELIESPPPPSASNRTFCEDDVTPTLTATPGGSGTLHWYDGDDVDMITPLHVANTPFVHGKTEPGVYTFWVREIQLPSPPGCIGEPRLVTLTILPRIQNNIISADQTICAQTAPFEITGAVPTGGNVDDDPQFVYQWMVSTDGVGYSNIAGATGQNYQPPVLTQDRWYVRIARSGIYTYFIDLDEFTGYRCEHTSDPVKITVNPLAVINTHPVNSAICAATNTTFTVATAATPAVTGRQWQVSTDGGTTWTNLANGGVYSGVTTATLTLTSVPASYNGYRYRVLVSTNGPCQVESNPALLTVHPRPVNRTVTAEPAFVCYNSSTNIVVNLSETGTAYQLRVGGTNVGGPQNGTGANLNLPTGNRTANTTFNVRASRTTTIGSSTLTCTRDLTDTPLVTVNPQLTMPALTHPAVCVDGEIDLPQASPAGGSGTYSYSWSTNSGTPYSSTVQNPDPFTPTVTGNHSYTVVATDAGFLATSGGVSCQVPRNVDFVVNPLPDNKVIAPQASLICYNTSTSINIPASQSGVRYYLRRASDHAELGNVLGNGAQVSVSTGLLTATTDFYVVAQNTTTLCSRTLNTVTVNVNPRFQLAQLQGVPAVCSGYSTNIRVVMTGGVGPYTVNYTANGVAQPQLNGYVSGADIPTGPLTVDTEYIITSVTDANNCPVESTGTPITILVGSIPVSAVIGGSTGGCDGVSSTISVTITGGAPPYTLQITGHGPVNNYYSGTPIDLGILAIGTHNFTLTSVVDDCGNFVPAGGLSGPHTIIIDEVPSAAATANNSPILCNDGTTDIVLQSTVPGTDFVWTVSYPGGVSWVAGKAPEDGSRNDGIGFVIAQQLAHTGSAPVTVTYEITPYGPGATACPGAAITRQVIVEPTPEAAITNSSQSICNGAAIDGMVISSVATHNGAPVFDLLISALSGELTDLTTGGNALTPVSGQAYNYTISGTITNNSDEAVTIQYRVIPRIGGCTPGDEVIATVVVEPSPKAEISNPVQALCNGESLTAMVVSTPTTSVGALTFDMTINAITGNPNDLVAGGNALDPVNNGSFGHTISGSLTNPTDNVIIFEYRVTPKLDGCANGTVVTATVTVEPTPKAAISNGTQVNCNGSAITPMVISPVTTHSAAATFDLAIVAVTGDLAGLTATGNALTTVSGGSYNHTISGSLTNNTDDAITIEYRVTPRLAGCGNGDVVTATITVEPTPKAAISNGAQVICDGASLDEMLITSLATHNGTPSFDLEITAVTGNLAGLNATGNALTPVSGGSYPHSITGTLENTTDHYITVQYRVIPKLAGCGDGTPVIATVTVEPTPKATVTNTPQSICDGAAINEMVVSSVATHLGTPHFDMVITALTGNLANLTATGNALTEVTGQGYPYAINGTLTNNSTEVISVEYRVTPRLPGCTEGADAIAMVVVIEPTPEAAISNPLQTICDGAAVTDMVISSVTSHSGTPGFNMAIVAITGNLGDLTATGNLLNPVPVGSYPYTLAGTLANNTDQAITIEYRVTPTLDGCANGDLKTARVTIEPTPKAAMTNTAQTLCNGTALTPMVVSGVATHSGTPSFDMDIVAVTGSLAGLSATGNALTTVTGGSYNHTISGTLTNNTDELITIEYRVTPRLGSCASGDVVTATVTIEPTPKAAITNAVQTVCNGASIAGMVISSAAVTSGTQSFDLEISAIAGNLAAVSGTGNVLTTVSGGSYSHTISGTLTNSSDQVVTIQYRVIPRLGTCTEGTPVIATVTVEPTPRAEITNDAQTICNSAAIDAMVISSPVTTSGAQSFDLAIEAITGSLADLTAGGNALTTRSGESYNYTISGTLTNNSDAAITIRYTVTPRLNGCGNGTPVTATVTVEPTPRALVSNSVQTICNGQVIAGMVVSSPVTSVAAQSFDMAIVAVTGDLADLGVTGNALTPVTWGAYGYTIAGTLTNNTDAAIVIEYRVTPKLVGCADGDVVVARVTVEPSPRAAISNDIQTLCNGAALDPMVISSAASPTGDESFDLAIVAVTGNLAGLSATGNALDPITGGSYNHTVSGTLTNNTSAAITIEYRVTPKLNGCSDGTPVIATVTVEPTPAAAISNNAQVVCDGAAIDGMVISSTAVHSGAASFDMAIVAVTGSLADLSATGNALDPVTGGAYGYAVTGTLANNTDEAITIEYRVTPKLAGCGDGTVVTATITIEPTPRAAISNDTQVICDGASLDAMVITNLAVHNGTPLFDLDIVAVTGDLGGLVATGNALATVSGGSYPYSITGTLENTTDHYITIEYRVTPKLGLCAEGDVVVATVTVEPTPKAAVSNTPQSICDGAAITEMLVTSVATHFGTPNFDMVITALSGNLGDLVATGNALTPVTGQGYPYAISGTLTNTSGDVISIEYRVTPRLPGCADGDDAIAMVIVIEPTPAAAISNDLQTICNGASVTPMVISPTTSHSGTPRFDLQIVAITGNLADLTATGNLLSPVTGGSYNHTLSGTLTNSTDEAITIEYRVTPTLDGCADGDVVTARVTIEPAPKAAISNALQTICNGGSLVGMVVSSVAVHSGTPVFDMEIVAVTGNLADLTATGNALTEVTGQGYGYTISGTLTNATSSSIVIQYRVTPRLGTCAEGDVVVATVTVEPTPAAAISNDLQTICEGGSLNPMVITSAATVTKDESFDMAIVAVTGSLADLSATGNALTGVTGQGYGYSVSGTISNSTSAAITIEYRVTPRLDGCAAGDVVVARVTIEPTPAAAISNDLQTICDGGALTGMTVSSAATVTGDESFDLEIVAVTGNLSDLSATGNALTEVSGQGYGYVISGTLANATSSAITIEYRVTPRLGSCSGGVPVTARVTVEPMPRAAISNDAQVICDGAAIDAMVVTSAASPTGAESFDMTITAVTGNLANLVATGNVLTPVSGESYGYIISGTLENTTDNAITIQYSVTPRLAGCGSGTPVVATITVEPTPKAAVTNANQTICDGAPVTGMVISSVAGHSGTPTFDMEIVAVTGSLADLSSTGNALTGVSGGSYNYTISGTLTNNTGEIITIEYRITPLLGTCTAGDVVTARVTIRPTPTVTIDGTTTVCQNDANPMVTFTNPMELPVTVTYNINGGSLLTVNVAAHGSATVAAPTLAPGVFNYNLVSLAYQGGPNCPSPVSGSVDVTVRPTPVATITGPLAVCQDAAYPYIVITNPMALPVTVTYNINSGAPLTVDIDGNSSVNIERPTEVPGTYVYALLSVQYQDGPVCPNPLTATHTIAVNPTPVTSNIFGNAQICENTEDRIFQVINTPGSTYTWSVPETLVTKKFDINTYFIIVNGVPGASGTGEITVFETALGCPGEPKIIEITVTPLPDVAAVTGETDICVGGTATYSVPFNDGSTYAWSIPAGATIISDPSLHTVDITFNLVLENQQVGVVETNGSCMTAHDPLLVTVHALPLKYAVTAPTFYCHGEPGVTVTLANSQTGMRYQLLHNGSPVGPSVNGTDGTALHWDNMMAGVYTVEASRIAAPFCPVMMNGNPVVEANMPINVNAVNVVMPLCNGGSNGSIEIFASGGLAPLSYSINGGSSFQSTRLFSGLAAGTYDIVVRDARGCVTSDSRVIGEPDLLEIISLDVLSEITCHGAADGSLQVTASGGTGVYSYEWFYDSGLTSPVPGQVSDVAVNMGPGTYWVRVTDQNGCRVSGSISIGQPDAITATIVVASNYNGSHISCFGAADGEISVTASGGTGSLHYELIDHPGNTSGAIDGYFIGLSAGYYRVRITDENGCSFTTPEIQVVNPEQVAATAAVTSSFNGFGVSCNGATDGVITVTATGGTGALTYVLVEDPSNDSGVSTGVFTGLPAGSYTVTVTDLNGCHVTTASVTVTGPAVLVAGAIAESHVVCFGGVPQTLTSTAPATGGIGLYAYQWQSAADLGGPWSDIPGADQATYTPPAGVPSTIHYRRGVSSGTCTPVYTGAVTVIINPELVATAVASQTICTGENIADIVAGTVGDIPGVTFEWTRTDGGVGGIPLSGTGSTISGSLSHAFGTDVTVTFTITPYLNGCAGTPAVSEVVVRPSVTIGTQPADTEVCEDGVATFTVIASGADSYQWYVNDGGGWTVLADGAAPGGEEYSGTGSASLVITNVHAGMQGYRYRAELDGCGGGTVSAEAALTVLMKVVIEDLIYQPEYCVGQPALYEVVATGAGTLGYQWQISTNGGVSYSMLVDGGEFSGSNTAVLSINPVSSFMNNYRVRVIVTSNRCSPPVTSSPMVINSIPAPLITLQPLSMMACDGTDADFLVQANGNGLQFEWQWLDGLNWITVVNDVDHEIVSLANESRLTVKEVDEIIMQARRYRVVVSNDCGNAVSVEAMLTIRSAPVIFARPSDRIACEGEDVAYTVTESSFETPSYLWQVKLPGAADFTDIAAGDPAYTGQGTPGLTVLNVVAAMDSSWFRVIVTNGCGSTISHDALLTVDPQVVFTQHPASMAVCQNGTAILSAQAVGRPVTGMTDLAYQWETFTGGFWHNVVQTMVFRNVNTPSLEIVNPALSLDGSRYRLRATGKCGTSWSDEVVLTVHSLPQPSILPDPAGVTTGNVLVLDGNPQGGSGTYVTHLWEGATSLLDNVNIQQPQFSSATTGQFVLTYRVTDSNGCQGEDIVVVTVSETLIVEINADGDGEVCAESNMQLAPVISGGSSIYPGHEWSGSGAVYLSDPNIPTPVFNSAVPGIYELTYTVTDHHGSQGTAVIQVTVFERPTVNITGDGQFPLVCGGTELQLNGNPQGGSGIYPMHRWTGQTMPLSNSAIADPVFNTRAAGTFTMQYQVTDSRGCRSDIAEVAIVNDIPHAGFSSDDVPACTPMEVNFTNNSLNAVAYEWDFGDGSPVVTTTNATHLFENLSTTIQYFNVELTAISSNGCRNTAARVITVYPGISSEITVSDNGICSPGVVTFNATPGGVEYFWDFGDGNQALAGPRVIHQYTNTTASDMNVTVSLRTTSFYGCIHESEYDLVIWPTPTAAFVADPPSQVFPSSTVNFTNQGSSGSAYSYLWDFGDGNVSTAENPSHTYDMHGDYNVTLIVSNANCQDEVAHKVTIEPTTPVSRFSAISPDCAPYTVTFDNTSTDANSYHWDFGDGQSSIERNPTHTYRVPGTYRVRLTATGDGGTDRSTRFVTVLVTPTAYMLVAPNYVYVNDEHVVTFNLSVSGDKYLWNFGDNNYSNEFEPSHVYTQAGIYDVSLEVWTDEGCYDKYTIVQAVEVDNAGELRFPTGFRPGEHPTGGYIDPSADEYERNKVFAPGVVDKVSEYRLTIHNRWGEMIFESFDINVGWDGFVRGVKAKQDVYIWKVTGKYSNGEPFVMAGDITLLR